MRVLTIAICANAIGAGCRLGGAAPAANWADVAPGQLSNRPQIVAPGVVSTPAPEFAFAVGDRGQTLYFNRGTPDRSSYAIFWSQFTGGHWSTPVPMPFTGAYRDFDPFVTADGARLYFSSNRPRTAPTAPQSFSTWYVKRTPGGWSAPIDAGVVLNSDSSDLFVSQSREGALFFGSNRDGAPKIYRSKVSGAGFAEPVALPFRETGWINPLVTPSGKMLFLARNTADRGLDLFYSCQTRDGWSEPIALPEPINSAFADFAPGMDASEHAFYFTSERPGVAGPQPTGVRPPGDIYVVSARELLAVCRR